VLKKELTLAQREISNLKNQLYQAKENIAKERADPRGILYIIFYSFDRIFLEKVFSTVFTRIFYRKYFLEKIPVNFYSGFISIPLDCFCARSYLRSLKSLIFGGGRRRNIRAATIMHLPKRIFYRKLVLQDFSRENSRYRNFL